jgi:hypothetical protein
MAPNSHGDKSNLIWRQFSSLFQSDTCRFPAEYSKRFMLPRVQGSYFSPWNLFQRVLFNSIITGRLCDKYRL